MKNRSFFDKIIISETNKWYQSFNILVTVLCLVSGYYYGAIAGFRYTNLEIRDEFNITLQIFAEIIFFIHMCLQFILEITIDGSPTPQRDFKSIAFNYLKTNFAIDFITMIPIQFLDLKRKRQYMFYAIKLLRIKKGFRLFDVSKLMRILKNRYKEKLAVIIEEDHDLANNVDIDNNKIEELLRISYVLKTIKLIIIIINISFLTGTFWLMLCEFVHDFVYDIDPIYDREPGKEEIEYDLFITTFGLENMERKDSLILVVYFAFTSLSTVGFGDYHPRGDIERVVGAFILLIGVAIFTYIISIFKDIMKQISDFNADSHDGDNLNRFF